MNDKKRLERARDLAAREGLSLEVALRLVLHREVIAQLKASEPAPVIDYSWSFPG